MDDFNADNYYYTATVICKAYYTVYRLSKSKHIISMALSADGTPPDGRPLIVIHTVQIWLIAVFYFLTVVGIAFAVGCLCFNFLYRKTK